MTDDLVKRLRKIADASRREDGSDIPLGEHLREAADAIERLTRERDEARQSRDLLLSSHRKIEAENARLREARPGDTFDPARSYPGQRNKEEWDVIARESYDRAAHLPED